MPPERFAIHHRDNRVTSLKHAHRGVVIGAVFYFAAVSAYCLYSYFTRRAELLAEIDHRFDGRRPRHFADE